MVDMVSNDLRSQVRGVLLRELRRDERNVGKARCEVREGSNEEKQQSMNRSKVHVKTRNKQQPG